jgi:hypothetical protein
MFARRIGPGCGGELSFARDTIARRRGRPHAIVAATLSQPRADTERKSSIALVSAGGNIPAAAAIVVAQKIRNFPMRCRDLSAMSRDRSCTPVIGTGFAKSGLGILDSGRNTTIWNRSGTIRMM